MQILMLSILLEMLKNALPLTIPCARNTGYDEIALLLEKWKTTDGFNSILSIYIAIGPPMLIILLLIVMTAEGSAKGFFSFSFTFDGKTIPSHLSSSTLSTRWSKACWKFPAWKVFIRCISAARECSKLEELSSDTWALFDVDRQKVRPFLRIFTYHCCWCQATVFKAAREYFINGRFNEIGNFPKSADCLIVDYIPKKSHLIIYLHVLGPADQLTQWRVDVSLQPWSLRL